MTNSKGAGALGRPGKEPFEPGSPIRGEVAATEGVETPEQYAAFVQNETEKFGEIIRRENLQMDVNRG